jgi:hypothetical protein
MNTITTKDGTPETLNLYNVCTVDSPFWPFLLF